MRILLIGDDPSSVGRLERGLQENGYAVETAPAGKTSEDQALAGVYELVILDLDAGAGSATATVRRLREGGLVAKVLLIVPPGSTDEGATDAAHAVDGVLARPVEVAELISQVQSLFRRGADAAQLRYEDLELDLRTRLAKRGDRAASLPMKEFMVLEYMMRNPGRVLSRNDIAEKMYNDGWEPKSNVVDVYVAALRRKYDRGFERRLFHTIKGVGYRLGE